MYLLVLCIFVIKLVPSKSQFPQHLDLHKVGEIIFNNEKYNVLRPTTHILSDYFQDFMLRRDNSDFPTKRVFIDDNGFRHYWSGYEKQSRSLRKTDTISNIVDTSDGPNIEKDEHDKINNREATKRTTEVDDIDIGDSSEDRSLVKTTVTYDSHKIAATDGPLKALIKRTREEKRSLNKKHKSKSKIKQVYIARAANDTNKEGKERNVVKTTFFCPFFGVITMSAFVD